MDVTSAPLFSRSQRQIVESSEAESAPRMSTDVIQNPIDCKNRDTVYILTRSIVVCIYRVNAEAMFFQSILELAGRAVPVAHENARACVS